MNNYSIDASVFAYPFNEFSSTKSKKNKLKHFLDAIGYLLDLVNNKRLYIRFFLFDSDIRLIIKNQSLLLSDDDIEKLNGFCFKNNIFFPPEFKTNYGRLINKLKELNELEPESTIPFAEFKKYICFEKWFDIKKVSKFISAPPLPDNIEINIKSQILKNNLKKKIAILVALNEYVYGDNNTHKLVLSNNISSNQIPVTANFEIEMMDNSNKVHYEIYNFPTDNKIDIKNKIVKVTTLSEVVKDRPIFSDWRDALNVAKDVKNGFKNLKWGNEVEDSIEQYYNKLLSEKLNPKNDVREIEEWEKEFPSVMYNNLATLDKFGKSLGQKTLSPMTYNNCHCNQNDCNISNNFKCGSHLRFFGVDCAGDEKLKLKYANDQVYILEDRTRKTSINNENKEEFWEHLRINRYLCYEPLWFLTMRIHFRFRASDKIEIGWIGRHFYQPCRFQGKCPKPRANCPLYLKSSLYDPDPKKKYQNFLKQYT